MDARIAELFGDATRLLGDTKVTLVEHGPFHWLNTDAVLTFDVRALFLDDDRRTWITKPRDLDTFRWLVARVRPSLEHWEPIVRAHSALTFDDPILDEDRLRDLGDARWYVMPIGDAAWKAWHAPKATLVDDQTKLVWFVEKFPHQAQVLRVIVDDAYGVDVTPIR